MTDTWRGLTDQLARDLVRVKDERDVLRREVERLRAERQAVLDLCDRVAAPGTLGATGQLVDAVRRALGGAE